MTRSLPAVVAGIAALLLAGCATQVVPPGSTAPSPASRPTPATPIPALPPTKPLVEGVTDARMAGVVAGSPIADLPFKTDQARLALQAFRISCPSLLRRTDTSLLTRNEDWRPACDAAAGWSDNDAAGFFRRHFETVQVGEGAAFATGYYEPEIAGSRTRGAGYEVPVYRRPDDLIEAELGLFADSLKGRTIRGRIEKARLVPYADRTAIEEGALAGRGLEIAWAADTVEFFFLQIQGSGRLRLPDGQVMRIGYDTQNGRDYVGIGSLMRQRGLLKPGEASMQGIVRWLHEHPDEGKALMRENGSFVFFRELTGPGPLGALGLPVTARATVAADPKFVPLGTPVWLSLDRVEGSGVWVAQDTGGAIKGANRFDTFWGAGDEARAIAGGMSGKGTAFLLLPLGTLSRLQAEAGNVRPSP